MQSLIQEESKEVVAHDSQSPEYKMYIKIADEARTYLEANAALTKENNWQLKDDSRGFKIHTRLDPVTGHTFTRGEGLLPYS